jgi:hypothetical protein
LGQVVLGQVVLRSGVLWWISFFRGGSHRLSRCFFVVVEWQRGR